MIPILTTILASTLAVPAVRGQPTMKAGFAKVCITPPLGTRMMGFGNRDDASGCTAVHDDIFVRALYLECEGERTLIMGFDLCFVGRADCDRFRAHLGERLGLRPEQMLFNASHSHVGPSVGTWYRARYLPPDTAYLAQLDAAVLQAGVEAQQQAREVTVSVGATSSALPMNRRRPEEGAILMAPNPEGPVNDALPLCLFRDHTGAPVCLLFSVACHPSLMSGHEISAEYPGVAMARIDEYLGTSCSLFLQGTGGDAKPSVMWNGGSRYVPGTWELMTRAGEMVAGEVIRALESGLHPVAPRLRTDLLELQWPLAPGASRETFQMLLADPDLDQVKRLWAQMWLERLDRGEPLPSSMPLLLQFVALGEGVRIVALEGEPTHGWGKLIQDFFAPDLTFALGYTNGEAAYLPTSEQIPEGGYEVVSYWEYGWPSPLAPGFEDVLRETLEEIKARTP